MEIKSEDLQGQIDALSAKLEDLAQMITRYGTSDPGLATDELPLRDRVEALEAQVFSGAAAD